MGEAPLERTEAGLEPAGEGWFVVNVRDAAWWTNDAFGSTCRFESEDERAEFPQLGINVRVLYPGRPNCRYHRESQQEAILVLSGTCRLLVEEQERQLGPWDFVHLPPNVDHVLVGAGDGPCVVVMAGSRTPDEVLVYPVSELAARYGASVEQEVYRGEDAYANDPRSRRERPEPWDGLPWA